jgi:hypothetical protein
VSDLASAIRALIATGATGARIQIEPRSTALAERRAAGLTRDDEGALLTRAWTLVDARRPGAGQRAGWASYDLVLPGERAALVSAARGLLSALLDDRALAAWTWQLVLTAITDDVDRVLLCDASYDLADAPAGDVIAWITPYAEPDWRMAQRYPTVAFEPPLVERRPAR